MPPKTGRVVAGRYRLLESIGRGAMGVVWRATDQLLGREVAVKEVRLNPALGDVERANAYKRTLREARTAARLSHRGLVTIFDVVEEDGRPWIIMELIRSKSLDEILGSQGRLPPRRAARVAQQLLSALAHAHGAGVLHRDVKPSNVLISSSHDERAVLTDFGIAQFAGDSRLTQTGMVMGSPGFTAPERIRGGSATPASDLWSLGATIFAACEGQGPYEHRGGAITTMSAIINEDAPQTRAAGRLGPVIAALLSRDPARRPSASSAASMIDRILPSLPDAPAAHPRTPTTLPRASRPAPPAPAAPSPDLAPTGVDQPQPDPVRARAGQGPNSAPPSRTDPPAPAPQPPLATRQPPDTAGSDEPASRAAEAAEVADEESDGSDTAPYDATADDDGPDTAPYDAATESDEKRPGPAGASGASSAGQPQVIQTEAERKTSRIATATRDKAVKPAAGRPASGKLSGSDPAGGQLGAGSPASGDPGGGQLGADSTASGDPGRGQLGAGGPAGGEPGGGQLGAGSPASGDPGRGQREADSTADGRPAAAGSADGELSAGDPAGGQEEANDPAGDQQEADDSAGDQPEARDPASGQSELGDTRSGQQEADGPAGAQSEARDPAGGKAGAGSSPSGKAEARDPAGDQPEAGDLTGGKPGAGSSSSGKTGTGTSVGPKPGADKDEPSKDSAGKPWPGKSTTGKGIAAKLAASQPAGSKPAAGQPAAARLAADQPAASHSALGDNTADDKPAGGNSADGDTAGKLEAGKAAAGKDGAAKSAAGNSEGRADQNTNAGRDTDAGRDASAAGGSAKDHRAGKDAASGNNVAGGNADASGAAEDKQQAPAVVTSMETTVRAKPPGAASPAPPQAAVKASSSAPLTAATTRVPRPGTADKEPWWANAYQTERRPNASMHATKPDGRYPLAPTLQQPPARQGASRAGVPGMSGAGRVPPDSIQPRSPAGAAGPGTSGARRKVSRKVVLLVLALVIIVAAGAVTMTVLSEHGGTASAAQGTPADATGTVPSLNGSSPGLIVAINGTESPVPNSFTTRAFTPAQTTTTAGFSIAYPGSWQVKQQSGSPQRVFFDAPDGVSNVEVDLTPHTKSNMVTEAEYLRSQTLAQKTFPAYKEIRLSAEDVRGTPGAIWAFYYTNSAGTPIKVEDILFILHTKNGPQSYAILATSPNSVWQSTMLPRVEDMLKTFQPNP